jgi:nicotinamide mononucleotide adenylyltransferase
MSLGLFIGRLNPPHIWHTWIIRRALNENDKVLILLWTPLIPDDNNPFDFDFRKKLLKKIFNEDNLNLIELLDDKSDLIWVKNTHNIINKNYTNIININLYLWDFENDSTYNVIKEYEKEFENYNIEYILESRRNSFVNYDWKKYKISATTLRKALKNWNIELVKQLCDKEIFEFIKNKF